MNLTGSVADQSNGTPIKNATIWEVSQDGQSANVVGFTDPAGKFSVDIDSTNSTINFVQDGYTGVTIPAIQALASDQILLAPDGSFSAKVTLQNVPSWLWVLVGATVIFLIGDGKKKK